MLVLFLRFSKIGVGFIRYWGRCVRFCLLALNQSCWGWIRFPMTLRTRSRVRMNWIDIFWQDLLAVYKYLISDVEDSCVGVYFDFGDCGFSVLESEDNLSIVDGVVRVSDDVALSKLEI